MTTLASEGGTRPAGIRDVLRVRLELWIAVILMALAFGAGMAVDALSQPEPVPATASIGGGSVAPFAPPLTDQQLQEGLPPGHPALNGDAGTSGNSGDQAAKAKDKADDSSRGTDAPQG